MLFYATTSKETELSIENNIYENKLGKRTLTSCEYLYQYGVRHALYRNEIKINGIRKEIYESGNSWIHRLVSKKILKDVPNDGKMLQKRAIKKLESKVLLGTRVKNKEWEVTIQFYNTIGVAMKKKNK